MCSQTKQALPQYRKPWQSFQLKFSLAKKLFTILKTDISQRCLQYRSSSQMLTKCRQQIPRGAGFMQTVISSSCNIFQEKWVVTNSFHDLPQNTRREVSCSRNDFIQHGNCSELFPLLQAATQLSHIHFMWLRWAVTCQSSFFCLAMQEAVLKGIPKWDFGVGVNQSFRKVSAFSKSSHLPTSKFPSALGIFRLWVLLPLYRCQATTDKNPITTV